MHQRVRPEDCTKRLLKDDDELVSPQHVGRLVKQNVPHLVCAQDADEPCWQNKHGADDPGNGRPGHIRGTGNAGQRLDAESPEDLMDDSALSAKSQRPRATNNARHSPAAASDAEERYESAEQPD